MKSPVAKEGISFIFFSFLSALISFSAGFHFLAFFSLILLFFFAFFFRQPIRNNVLAADKIYAPADGKIIGIEEEVENNIFRDKVTKISIFMSVFNVHINYAPANGEIFYLKYTPGAYYRADILRKEERNENNLIGIKNSSGTLAVRQVAGLIARRIVFDCQLGDQLTAGRRFGMVKFGSRVDIYIPVGWQLKVTKGQTVRAGKTVIAGRE